MRTLEQLAEDAYQIYRANAGVAARPWSELPPAARAAWLASITFAVIEAKRDRVSAPPGMVKAVKPAAPSVKPAAPRPPEPPLVAKGHWHCGNCLDRGCHLCTGQKAAPHPKPLLTCPRCMVERPGTDDY